MSDTLWLVGSQAFRVSPKCVEHYGRWPVLCVSQMTDTLWLVGIMCVSQMNDTLWLVGNVCVSQKSDTLSLVCIVCHSYEWHNLTGGRIVCHSYEWHNLTGRYLVGHSNESTIMAGRCIVCFSNEWSFCQCCPYEIMVSRILFIYYFTSYLPTFLGIILLTLSERGSTLDDVRFWRPKSIPALKVLKIEVFK